MVFPILNSIHTCSNKWELKIRVRKTAWNRNEPKTYIWPLSIAIAAKIEDKEGNLTDSAINQAGQGTCQLEKSDKAPHKIPDQAKRHEQERHRAGGAKGAAGQRRKNGNS